MTLEDAGEILPFAKKERFEGNSINNDSQHKLSGTTTLSQIWPEPKWKELAKDHPCKEALLKLMYIYKSTPNEPNLHLSIKGISTQQAIEGYKEVVGRFSKINPSTVTNESLDKAIELFRKIYSEQSKKHCVIFAGKHTRKTVNYFPVLSTKHKKMALVLSQLGWPELVSPSDIEYLPIELYYKEDRNNPKRTVYVLGNYNQKSVTYIKGEYDTQDEAIAEIKRRVEEKKGPLVQVNKQKDEPEPPPFEPKKIDQCDGFVIELGMTPQNMIDTFGFRGIQFGTYVTAKERQIFVDNTYASLIVLSSILGIPERNLTSEYLGLAFGARGTGNAAAHFEPDLSIINLTRANGGGALSHEWFHFWDSKIAELCGYKNKLYSEIDLYERLNGDYPLISKYFDELIFTVLDQKNYLNRSKNITAQKRASKYWSKPCELLARAFECYIQDSMAEQGIHCPWLACGTTRNEMEPCPDAFFPYPEGYERATVNKAFSGFFSKISKRNQNPI